MSWVLNNVWWQHARWKNKDIEIVIPFVYIFVCGNQYLRAAISWCKYISDWKITRSCYQEYFVFVTTIPVFFSFFFPIRITVNEHMNIRVLPVSSFAIWRAGFGWKHRLGGSRTPGFASPKHQHAKSKEIIRLLQILSLARSRPSWGSRFLAFELSSYKEKHFRENEWVVKAEVAILLCWGRGAAIQKWGVSKNLGGNHAQGISGVIPQSLHL